jgi:putative polyketide hydroxylase
MSGRNQPVLIVGAGAGGLAASALLAQHGVHSLPVEKTPRSSCIRRRGTSPSAPWRYCAGWGSGPRSTRWPSTCRVSSPRRPSAAPKRRRPLIMDSIVPDVEGLSPEPFGKYCPQSKLESILLAETRRLGSEIR